MVLVWLIHLEHCLYTIAFLVSYLRRLEAVKMSLILLLLEQAQDFYINPLVSFYLKLGIVIYLIK